MLFRFRYKVEGGHVYVRVFTANHALLTWEKSGDLVFRVSEWDEVKEKFQNAVEFKHEDEA